MKHFILVILLITSLSSYSQNCEGKKDEFTGKEIIEYDFGKKAVKFRIEDDKIYLEMRFNYRGEQNVVMPVGTEYFIKLKNDEVLNLKTVNEAPPTSTVSGTVILTLYTYEFVLTKNQLNQLASSEADKIRYPNPEGGFLDFELKGFNKRIRKHLSKGSECMLSQLNS